MGERFAQFRLSLMPRAQRDAFSGLDPTREEYLRKVFGRRINYSARKTNFQYIPSLSAKTGEIIAQFGRETIIRESVPTPDGFEDHTHTGWKSCVLVIDPADHEDGQKVAVEFNSETGDPWIIIQSIVKAINEQNPHTAYFIEVLPIVDASQFWDWVAEHEKHVTSVQFDLVVPNGLFSANNSVANDLREQRDTLAAREISLRVSNKDGLRIRSKQVVDSVEYAERNGGRIRARAKRGAHFNSTKQPKTVTLPESEAPDEHIVIKVARLIVEIFGRE